MHSGSRGGAESKRREEVLVQEKQIWEKVRPGWWMGTGGREVVDGQWWGGEAQGQKGRWGVGVRGDIGGGRGLVETMVV